MSEKKKLGDLITDNKENAEKLSAADIKAASDKDKIEKKISKLILANKENALTLSSAYKIINTQKKEIKKQAADLISAKKELAHKTELIILNKELTHQIEKRKQNEKALLKLDMAINTSGEVIFMTDIEGTITYINKEFTKIYGFTAEEVVGKATPRILNSGLYPKDYHEQLWHTLLNKQRLPTAQYINKCKNGNLIDVEGSANSIIDDKGEIIGFLGIQRDISERKQAESRIRGLTSIIENFLNEIYVFDTATLKFVYVNQGALKNLGFSGDEILALTPVDIKPEFTTDSFLLAIEPLLTGKKDILNFETIHQRKNGNTYPVDIYLQLSEFEGKQVYVAIILDITERKKIEEEMNFHKIKLELALQSSQMGTWEFNIVENKRIFDNQACFLLGIDSATFGGTAEEFFSVVHPDDHEKVKGALKKTVEQNVSYKPEYRTIWHDGSIHHISARGKLLHDDKGNPQMISGIIWNNTENKQKEEELKNSEAKHSSMISNISDVIGIIGLDGFLKYKSPNVEKWFGWQPQDLVGIDGFSNVHPDDLERIQQEFVTLLEKENLTTKVEFRYKCKDGSYKPVELNAVNLTNDPLINGILINYHEITERKLAETQLQRMEKLLDDTSSLAQVGGWEIDLETQQLTWTKEVFSIHEVDVDFVPTVEKAINFYAPESQSTIQDAVARAIEHCEPFDVELEKSDILTTLDRFRKTMHFRLPKTTLS